MSVETPQQERPIRLVGGWWSPAVGVSLLGLYGSFQLSSSDELVRKSFFNDVAP